MPRRAWGLVLMGIFPALFALPGPGRAQQPAAPPGASLQLRRRPPGERAFGTVTSVGVTQFEIKKGDGSSLTVMVGDSTRYRQGHREIQLEDLKPGDHVFVIGQTGGNHQFRARMVRRMSQEEMARFRNMGDRAFGEIVSIKNNELKIRNPFRGEQTVVVNDQTQFLKDGEAITLKALKVGDRVFAMGKEEGGKLVANRVVTGRFRGRSRRRPGGGPPPPRPQE